MSEAHPDLSSIDTSDEIKVEGFYGPGGELDVTAVPTEAPGVYELHGTVLTTHFVKISEAYPDRPRIPLDWC